MNPDTGSIWENDLTLFAATDANSVVHQWTELILLMHQFDEHLEHCEVDPLSVLQIFERAEKCRPILPYCGHSSINSFVLTFCLEPNGVCMCHIGFCSNHRCRKAKASIKQNISLLNVMPLTLVASLMVQKVIDFSMVCETGGVPSSKTKSFVWCGLNVGMNINTSLTAIQRVHCITSGTLYFTLHRYVGTCAVYR